MSWGEDPLESGFATFCSQSQGETVSIQDQVFGPLSQLLPRRGDVSATEKTRDRVALLTKSCM